MEITLQLWLRNTYPELTRLYTNDLACWYKMRWNVSLYNVAFIPSKECRQKFLCVNTNCGYTLTEEWQMVTTENYVVRKMLAVMPGTQCVNDPSRTKWYFCGLTVTLFSPMMEHDNQPQMVIGFCSDRETQSYGGIWSERWPLEGHVYVQYGAISID